MGRDEGHSEKNQLQGQDMMIRDKLDQAIWYWWGSGRMDRSGHGESMRRIAALQLAHNF